VIVQIASRDMPVEDVLKLSPGAIIELPKLADEELEILVANKQIGLGTAVKVGENFGVRVSYVGDVRERIEALGRGMGAEERGEEEAVADADEPAAAIAEQLLAAHKTDTEPT
jgi:flagellar motor switch protein FliN/FliY